MHRLISSLLLFFTPVFAVAADLSTINQDYTFAFYPEGLRGRDDRGARTYAVRTSTYAFRINLDRGLLDSLVATDPTVDASDAASENRGLFAAGSLCAMRFEILSEGTVWRCRRFCSQPDQLRIIESGTWLQRFDLTGLEFINQEGGRLDLKAAVLEFFCWPDRFGARLRIAPGAAMRDLSARLVIRSSDASADFTYMNEHYMWHPMNTGLSATQAASLVKEGAGAAWLNPFGERQIFKRESKEKLTLTSSSRDFAAGESVSLGVVAVVSRDNLPLASYVECVSVMHPLGPGEFQVAGISPYSGPLDWWYDPVEGRHTIKLGENRDIWVNEETRFEFGNPYSEPRTIRLSFRKEGHFGVTGLGFVLRDGEGAPTGRLVQISKNWHEHPAWANGSTMLRMEPRGTMKGGMAVYYAKWEGRFAVSHAQLCLIGWGGHQQWDQMAIGSFGESITYDPEIGLNRSMVDDVRPLMVWGMGTKPETKWSWTHNVGGADFMLLHRKNAPGGSTKEYVTAQKTLTRSNGPLLADVAYMGEMCDGAITTDIRLRTRGCDDLVRAVYDIRMRVNKHVDGIDRFALFQLGADNYNENPFDRITLGRSGSDEVESWAPPKGGDAYSRRGVVLEGDRPWFVLHESRKPAYIKPEDAGAWADRGLIVLGWKARLGGEERPLPVYAIRGMGRGDLESSSLEIGGPAGLSALQPGDHAELQVEMLVIPQKASDYYGPDAETRDFLEKNPAWRLVPSEAESIRSFE